MRTIFLFITLGFATLLAACGVDKVTFQSDDGQ